MCAFRVAQNDCIKHVIYGYEMHVAENLNEGITMYEDDVKDELRKIAESMVDASDGMTVADAMDAIRYYLDVILNDIQRELEDK